jgi:hypothetical protein
MDDAFDTSRANLMGMTLAEFRAYRAELLAAQAAAPVNAPKKVRKSSALSRAGALRHAWANTDEA